MGPRRPAIVGERGVEDGAEGGVRYEVGSAGVEACYAGIPVVAKEIAVVGDDGSSKILNLARGC